jgi:hypothetical protein
MLTRKDEAIWQFLCAFNAWKNTPREPLPAEDIAYLEKHGITADFLSQAHARMIEFANAALFEFTDTGIVIRTDSIDVADQVRTIERDLNDPAIGTIDIYIWGQKFWEWEKKTR